MENLDKVTEKQEEKYPNSMLSWYQNWDVLTPIFKFSLEVRKDIYNKCNRKFKQYLQEIKQAKNSAPKR